MSKLLEQINISPRTTRKLGEVIDYIADNRGKNPSYYVERGIPVIDNFMITGKRSIDLSLTKRFIDEKICREFIRKEIKKDDILVTLVGNGFGQIALAPEERSVIIQNTVGLRSNDLSLNSYLFYLLSKYKEAITGLDRGAAQPSVKVGDLLDIEIDLPDLPTQKKIASILSAYDAKIENNNFIIKKLEATAQTLFDGWFVNFKFPGHEKVKFVDSEMGEIPEGWNVGQVKDLIKVESGFPFSSNVFDKNGKYKLVTIRNVQDGEFVPDCDNGISELPEKLPDYCKLKTGDILLSLTGNVGRICLVIGDDYVLNQRVAKLVPIDENNKPFAYFLFRKKEFQNLLINMAKGSAQPNLSPVDTKNMEIIIPEKGILKNFNRVTLPFLTKIVELKEENISLKSQRDRLLIKLI